MLWRNIHAPNVSVSYVNSLLAKLRFASADFCRMHWKRSNPAPRCMRATKPLFRQHALPDHPTHDLQVYGSTSADGGVAMFSCGTGVNTNRIIGVISPSGAVDTSTVYQARQAQYLPRGVASVDGVNLYAGDGFCIYLIRLGTQTTTDLNCVDWYYGQQVRQARTSRRLANSVHSKSAPLLPNIIAIFPSTVHRSSLTRLQISEAQ